MVTRLLDVSVLIALLWEDHEHYKRAQGWLAMMPQFATCPLVQLGFTRISSHLHLGHGAQPERAFSLLKRFLADARHRFVPDDLSCGERSLLTERIAGASQITDHYLAALARRHGLRLATFDAALSRAFGDGADLVELVP